MKRLKLYIPILISLLLLGCKSVTTATKGVPKETTSPLKYRKINTFKGTTNDTLAYVRTSIIDRKSEYIGKNLNVLLNDLELPINNYLIGSSQIRGISPDIALQFYPKNVLELKRQATIDPVILNIVWETPLPKDEVLPILLKSKGVWTNEEKEYYGKQKVKDILLTNYGF
ncbi:uncharacterized protein YceK [Flavobacterium sp. 7E]|uniref:hypothetical protein n=1 Tax=Flavobacterium sp. 7E TaxID=2735898 RepID=UPI001570FAC2|nr:hypothetical protein [Flavobacterium sp. 7E]NRS87716.1 uncharacterized protein YceK [Flavobacterium sp. 7E]